jgi:hypothetical protein
MDTSTNVYSKTSIKEPPENRLHCGCLIDGAMDESESQGLEIVCIEFGLSACQYIDFRVS